MKENDQTSISGTGICRDDFYIMLLEDPQYMLNCMVKKDLFEEKKFECQESRVTKKNDQLENLHLTLEEMELDMNFDEKQKQNLQSENPISISKEARGTTVITRVSEILRNMKKDNSIRSGGIAQCKICFKILKDKYNLSSHIDTIHKKMRPHKCVKCPAAFANLSNLISHINYVHKVDRPCKCQKCSKCFVNGAEARKHYNAVHANLRPHKCPICDRQFNHLSSLRRHNECVHENLRLHKCPKCSADYKDRNGLKKHLISHHVNGISMRKRKDKSLPPRSLYNNANNLKYHVPDSLSIYILDNLYP